MTFCINPVWHVVAAGRVVAADQGCRHQRCLEVSRQGSAEVVGPSRAHAHVAVVVSVHGTSLEEKWQRDVLRQWKLQLQLKHMAATSVHLLFSLLITGASKTAHIHLAWHATRVDDAVQRFNGRGSTEIEGAVDPSKPHVNVALVLSVHGTYLGEKWQMIFLVLRLGLVLLSGAYPAEHLLPSFELPPSISCLHYWSWLLH